MAWLIIRMIGRSKGKWSVSRGDPFPGRRVYPSAEADMFCRCRRAIELQRGMQRPSDLGGGSRWVFEAFLYIPSTGCG